MEKKFEKIKEWLITGLISPILIPIICLVLYLADWWNDND